MAAALILSMPRSPPGGSITQSTFEGQNWVIRGENGNFRQLIEGAPNQTVNYGEFGFDDTIDGGDGNDAIYGELGDDIINGGTGSDTIDGGIGDDTIDGGDGDDDIQGGAGVDSISGGAGFDYIDGGAGDDSILGGADDDTIIGGAGDDTLFGGDGNDTVSGNSGDDALHGDAGEDSLYGGSGEDYFDGGAGNDSLFMGDTSGFGTVDPSDGLRDVVRLHSGSDNDTAFDFDMANDYIFIGSADRADVILTQVSPSQWVATLQAAHRATV